MKRVYNQLRLVSMLHLNRIEHHRSIPLLPREILFVWGPKPGSQKCTNSHLCIRCHCKQILHSFEGKQFAFLQYQNIIEPKTMLVFKVYTLFNEEMSQDTYFSDKIQVKSCVQDLKSHSIYSWTLTCKRRILQPVF